MEPIFTIRFCGHALNVTKECIGINSMVSMLCLAIALAVLNRLRPHKFCLVLLCGAALAIAQNVLRIAIIVVASAMSYEIGTGLVHDMCGYFTFLVGAIFLGKSLDLVKGNASSIQK